MNVTRECMCGCWPSMLTSHHCREVESNLVTNLFTLSAITAFSFAHHIPSPLLLVMCFTCPNPTPGLALHRTASAQIGSTAPPLATLAPQNTLVVYIISVCCVARLGTCLVVCLQLQLSNSLMLRQCMECLSQQSTITPFY